MKKILLLLFAITSILVSCDKDYGTFNSDNRPEVPVTFPGTTTYGFNPYIEYSLSSGNNIEYTMSIPESSGRMIKELTKVSAGATSINAGTLKTSTYLPSPIAVNARQYKFSTSLTEYKTKLGLTSNPAVGSEIAFMFLITLDNDQTIIPVQVRARIVK